MSPQELSGAAENKTLWRPLTVSLVVRVKSKAQSMYPTHLQKCKYSDSLKVGAKRYTIWLEKHLGNLRERISGPRSLHWQVWVGYSGRKRHTQTQLGHF